ncbi:MAG: hypothetical protein CM1200mP15_00370 [Dehalococcoidia bacterium]|nr:MAG: hypothetical protein CM1200mP15_00370 [Dehalococcoidia bacterium]
MPSACAGWSVGDVLGHLTGQDFSLRILRGLQGNISAPDGSPQVDNHDEDNFAKSIFDRGIATKLSLELFYYRPLSSVYPTLSRYLSKLNLTNGKPSVIGRRALKGFLLCST